MKKMFLLSFLVIFCLAVGNNYAADSVPSTIDQPGTQPQEVSNLESPKKCDNCHGGYNTAVEPAFNWRGSMMAHAGRDPIFWASVAIAEQDFDGSGDLCIRCHSTGGWLGGRSTPTDGSGLTEGDSDGVECDYCHKVTNPNNSEHLGVMIPPFLAYDPITMEGFLGSGMTSIWGGSEKLGPYSDADAKHKFMKSKFHRSVDFCGTCHDVSNPAVGNLAHNFGAQPEFLATDTVMADGSPNEDPKDYTFKAAFNNPPYKYGVVERTFSEYKAGLISQTLVDDYVGLPSDLKGGALKAIYDDATKSGTVSANYEDGDLRYYSCQSCHMRPVEGQGCNKNPPYRTDLPLHDMTGGNYWMPEAIKYLDSQGKLRLGGGLSSSLIASLDAGALRAKQQLSLAATLSVQGNSLKIVNHTGHKLISGYPEGRRMWFNIKWYDDAGTLVREDGAYGPLVDVDNNGTPVTITNPADGSLVQVESILDLYDPNTKIYEAHYGIDQGWASQLASFGLDKNLPLTFDRYSGTAEHKLGELASLSSGAYESFHFVLNNRVLKDNRIPPYGMDYEKARLRNALPVPANQYGGSSGSTYDYFDTFALNAPQGATNATIDLLYQPTSWEYIQFLYLANKGTDPAQGGNAFLGMEGVNMLEAWINTGMASPYVMASTTLGTPPDACTAPSPTLLTATPGDKQATITWQEIPGDPNNIVGYKVYYDQAGKAQLIVDLPQPANMYTDTGLTNGQEYCYKVTSYYSDTCESGFSNIICVIPNNQGQARIGVDNIDTGIYQRIGKGKKATVEFVLTNTFSQGDGVVIRALVQDQSTQQPVQNAAVEIEITGPEFVLLTTGPSDSNGIAETTWQTEKPNKRGRGGTILGAYASTTTNVTATGYTWDGVLKNTTFTIE